MNYYVVAVGRGNMIDPFGRTIENVERPRPDQFIATLDLDLTGVRRLSIIVDFGESVSTGDYLLLCNARLSK